MQRGCAIPIQSSWSRIVIDLWQPGSGWQDGSVAQTYCHGWAHCASAQGMAAGEYVYGSYRLGLGFIAEAGKAAPLARHRDAVLHPAGGSTGRHYQENRLAHLSSHVLDFDQVAGRRREGCPGTPAACLFQNDGRLHAGIGSTQTPSTGSFGGLDHAHGQGWTRMNLTTVVECCGNYD